MLPDDRKACSKAAPNHDVLSTVLYSWGMVWVTVRLFSKHRFVQFLYYSLALFLFSMVLKTGKEWY